MRASLRRPRGERRRRFAWSVACVTALAMLPGHPAAAADAVWRVSALRYATVDSFPVRYLVAGADTTRTASIAMMVCLLDDGGGRHVLFDAGFHQQKFLDAWKPSAYVSPSEAVRRFGVPPDSITDVIVSHVHWDHMGGIDLFPNARVWIQKDEYTYYVGSKGEALHAAIDSLDAALLFRLHAAGRVALVDGDAQEILPGIRVYTGGKHTFASQYAGVRTARGVVVLASDNVYLYENLEKRAPIAQTLDAASNLAAQDRMKKLAASPRLIVPGHDEKVFERFRTVSPGAVRIE